jgi:hypothetical protein
LVVPLVLVAIAMITGLPVRHAPGMTGAGVVPDVPDDCPADCLMADDPVRVIPDTRKQSRPPPVDAVCVAVTVCTTAEVTSEVRTQIDRSPAVENPVNDEPIFV